MNHETIRVFIFFIILFCCLSGEFFIPYLKRNYKKRLLINFLFLLSGILFLKICFPNGLLEMTNKFLAMDRNLSLAKLPWGLDLILTLLIFDFAIYWQHRFFHMIKPLWKYHAVHHSDKSLDFSTALRFHPGEIVLSGAYKMILLYIFIPRLESFFIYEIFLNSMAIFNHSNIHLPKRWDYYLRFIIVTPAMHFPHHSPKKNLTNSNYGNVFSFWDRIFKTYTRQENSVFGLKEYTHKDLNSFWSQFFSPFSKEFKDQS
ncbi:MAG: sterol desaturase family protein [Bacteriovoracaceae bacterium]|jgi:sterol desaturase/sphingolipid hydroxylase (fatty acid hydroxylase superfamily)|nr:sterol desaturase family protein [Bacteriovoracaceae bacterium]